MTAKEKAQELVYKFRNSIVSFLSDNMKDENAKQCAIIAVEEVLSTLSPYIGDNNARIFWNEVKTEINKL